MRISELRSANLNLLVVLHSLSRTRSVGATAKELNMSQPAVSRALSQLRLMFQDPLLVKSGASMLITPRCEALGEELDPVLDGITEILDEPGFTPAETDRVFRIATTDYGATAVLPGLIRRFTRQAPHAGVEVAPMSERTFRDLAAGDVDVVLITDDADVPNNLHTRSLFRETYTCVVSARHRLADIGPDEPVAMDDYLAWPHALVVVFGGRLGFVDRELAKQGLQRRVALWLPYFSSAPLVAANSDVILTIPARVAQPFIGHASLALLAPPVALGGFGYRAVWHERTDKDRGARWFRNLLAESCKQSV